LDLAGVVTAAGANVTRFHPGDEVYGTSQTGSFAEYATAPQRRLARKPVNLSFGGTVTGVCRTSKVDLVRSLGADEVIDHTKQEIDRDGHVRRSTGVRRELHASRRGP